MSVPRGLWLAIAAAILIAVVFWFLPQPADPALSSAAGVANNSFVIGNVRVFDGVRVFENATVVVRDGRVSAVGSDLIVPTGMTLVDARGKTLLPGFIDSHTHSYGVALRDALQFGVTTELDMFTSATVLREHQPRRESLARSDVADLYSAGFLATVAGGHGTQFGLVVPTLDSPAMAQSWVDERLSEGSDYIKMIYEPGIAKVLPSLNLATVKALTRAAHGRQRLAVAHISRLGPAKEVVAAGVDGLVHVFADRPIDEEFIALLRANKVFVVPTLTVNAAIEGSVEAKRLLSDHRIVSRLSDAQRSTLVGDWPPRLSWYRFAIAVEATGRLHTAGIDILAGTDAPNPGTAHGASMHHELELLVRAGLSPAAALAAATSVPARRFALSDRGRIVPGARADLILVSGNPTEDIRATRALDRVWKNGYAVTLTPATRGDL